MLVSNAHRGRGCGPQGEGLVLLAVFQGFSDAERGERSLIFFHKPFHGFLVCPGILPESPANGLADEELSLVCSSQAQLKQQLLVCVLLLGQLMQKSAYN